jgi:hypothetical protein
MQSKSKGLEAVHDKRIVPGFNRFYFTRALDGAVAGAINELTSVALGVGGWKRDGLVFSAIIPNRPGLLLKEPDTNLKGGCDG